ncbi:MAG: nitrogen fixation protein NifM [Gammaproteobacteria bacterium]
MSATGRTAIRQEENAVYRYHLLRVALEHFQKNLAQLDDTQMVEVRKRASRTFDIESLVLATPEAREVVIDVRHLDAAVTEVSARYPDTQGFHADLTANGLDETALRSALYRELAFDGVLQRIGSRRPSINDIDMRLYYELNRDRFRVPEKRTARQILVTINPDYADNTRAAAQVRIGKIAAMLASRPGRFAEQARRYSECPSALEGGKLGEICRGQLFPELDTALYGLREGEISEVVETEIGYHLLQCEKIQPVRQVPYARAAADIHKLLDERHRRNCQKTWLSELVRQQEAQGARNDA